MMTTKDKLEIKTLDAGTRSLDHYKNTLPDWRCTLRECLIPIVRLETPLLAYLQEKYRTPALDTYFALAASLGTHTFFTIILPILFWCGQVRYGRAMTHTLASGVYFSGFVKDMLCLPRPMSPPLQRISKSHSAALEYGFPSTHSTNSVSVALYSLWALHEASESFSPHVYKCLQALLCFYAVSIVVGRVYCGMHGIFDVIVGSLLGAIIGAIQWIYGDAFDLWIINGPIRNLVIVTLVVCVLVRIHPEPADNCPCFDDSVSFSGVMIGIQIGAWHFARTGVAWDDPLPSTAPFRLNEIGWFFTGLRILLGVVVIFAWRGTMKPALFEVLPPIFRIIETLGLALPRKFFLRASQYKSVPRLRKDDNIIPHASDIPAIITSLRHPRRRAVSIGPQSEADAYEAMAFRERKRRQSVNSANSGRSISPSARRTNNALLESPLSSNPASPILLARASIPPSPALVSTKSTDGILEEESVLTPSDEQNGNVIPANMSYEGGNPEDDERNDKEMFLKLQKPRVRYDVEVVTRLIVYAGIGWIAVEGNPILFELCGMGMS